jgi:hypothetical protein
MGISFCLKLEGNPAWELRLGRGEITIEIGNNITAAGKIGKSIGFTSKVVFAYQLLIYKSRQN